MGEPLDQLRAFEREEARRADEEAARREQAQHVERRARELRRDEEAARKEQERIDADVARQLNALWIDLARPLAPAAAGPAPGQRRVVVIDGLNVARAQGYREPGFDYEKYRASERGRYPATFARAVKLAIDSLRAKGYHVHAFLPGWALDGGRQLSIEDPGVNEGETKPPTAFSVGRGASIACGVWAAAAPVNRARVATRSIVVARQPITTLFDQRCSKQCRQMSTRPWAKCTRRASWHCVVHSQINPPSRAKDGARGARASTSSRLAAGVSHTQHAARSGVRSMNEQ